MKASAILAIVTLPIACGPSYGVGSPLTVTTDTLVSSRVELAVPLADGSLLVDDGASLSIVRTSGEPLAIGLPGEIGTLRAYAVLDGTTLVAGSAGTFVVQTGAGAGLFRAPIESVIADEAIVALAATPREGSPSDLWVATDVRLYLFRDETLTEVAVREVPLGGAQLAGLGAGAVWAATSAHLVRLEVEPLTVTLSAAVLARPEGASSVAVDADGVLWMITDGQVASLRRDLHYDLYGLPFAPVRLFASSDADDVWFEVEGGGFYHQLHRVFRPVEGVSLESALGGPEGTLYARSASSVLRVRARHPLALEGLHDGPILEATRIELRLPSLEHVTAIRARAGTVVLEVLPAVAADPPAIILEPGPIPVGTHTLVIEADYDDGTLTASLRASIEIATDATWSADILPLYEAHCADCHGERGPSPTRLDAREAWMRLSTRIIDNVLTGRMPLGRAALPSSETALIQAWASGGFAE